jgi:predicted transcriptional regulator
MKSLANIGERLRVFLEAERMRPNTLARQSGNSSTQIYNILNGRKYGTDKLIQILEALPTLNMVWLVSGAGPMYVNKIEASSSLVNNSDSTLLHEKIKSLEKELENMQAMIKLQDMTIQAFKKSSEMAETSLMDLKRIANFYKERSENILSSKSA